jgi:hypothetical protein
MNQGLMMQDLRRSASIRSPESYQGRRLRRADAEPIIVPVLGLMNNIAAVIPNLRYLIFITVKWGES